MTRRLVHPQTLVQFGASTDLLFMGAKDESGSPGFEHGCEQSQRMPPTIDGAEKAHKETHSIHSRARAPARASPVDGAEKAHKQSHSIHPQVEHGARSALEQKKIDPFRGLSKDSEVPKLRTYQ